MQLSLSLSSENVSLKPRDYQIEVKKALYRLFNKKIKKVLIVAPTGAGKTVLATDIIQDAVSKKRKVLFLVHRDVLAEQTAETLRRNGVNCGFLMGTKKANPDALVQIASVQTMARRKVDFVPDVIFYDEAHLTAWASASSQLLKEDVFHIGLTATPWRLKKSEGMGDLFDELVHAPLPRQLMEMNYLVYPRYFILKKPDLKGVKIKGDYVTADLDRVCNVQSVIDNLVDNWLRIVKDKRTIVFAVNVAHAKNIAQSFNGKGINAEAVYGDMPIKQREVIYQQLKDGEIKVTVSCEALAEGFDVPSIECVVLARPTKSKAKYFQQVGRGLRISPNKKECLILDQAGLVQAFDPVEDLVSVALEKGKDVKKGNKKCEVCGCGIPPFLTICARCSEPKNKEKNLPIGEMVELVIAKGKKREFDWYRNRINIAFQKGYSPGWALYKFKEHYGSFPDQRWALNSIFGDKPTEENEKNYLRYLTRIAQEKGKSVKWIQQQFKNQFGNECPHQIDLSFSQSNIFEMTGKGYAQN
jgi:superfamily II DNA or RNA helicase